MSILQDRRPDKPGSRSFLPVICVLAVIFCVLLFFHARALVLAVVPEGEYSPLCLATEEGGKWSIRFTHSVEKTPVDEFFTVNKSGDMTMTHTRFESFGWGFPYSPQDGKISPTEDGRFELIMNRPYKDIKLRIAVQARPCIIHDGKTYDLCALFGQGTLVTIKAQRRYEYWLENYL